METAEIYKITIPRYPEFKNQVAVVTGSGRGIGKGIAIRLAREGMKVVINGRNLEEIQKTGRELLDLGTEVLIVQADLGVKGEIDLLFEKTLETFGSIDLLVNNAADIRRFHMYQGDLELLDHQVDVNIRGPYLCSWHAGQIMRKAKRGNIINVSSVGGIRAHWKGLPYDITKGAMDAMTRAMALELAHDGIRVNAIAPGPTRIEITPPEDDPSVQAVCRRVPLERFGLPQDMAATVAFLASSEASYITGQIIYIDGGTTAQLSPPGQPI